ncbi:MAG: ATP-binding cassette domain-containing protein, partial [Hypericibacter sp.]
MSAEPLTPPAPAPLLAIRNLSIAASGRAITIGTDLHVGRGETVAIVGESGSGKSLTAKAIVRLLPAGVSATGGIVYDGVDLG